jgi:nitrite reductase/ring-hydroxylating ferredoxin subunit
VTLTRPGPGTILCALADLGDPGAKGFSYGTGRDYFSIFVVRRGTQIFGYENSCPHAYTTLDYPEDRFLTADGSEILCGTHGARFMIDSGYCTLGPCRGQRLRPFPVAIMGDQVAVANAPAPDAVKA